MTIRTLLTQHATRLSIVAMLSIFHAAPSSAQITHAMVPKRDPLLNQDGSFKWPVGFHVFGGLSVWEFGYTPIEFDTTKARNGLLAAADFGTRVSDSVTIGAGGWYNGTNEYSVDGFSDTHDPLLHSDLEYRFKRRMYSIYGSAFWKVIGVQGGIVPTQVTTTRIVKATGASSANDDGGQVDADLFGVVRLGATGKPDPASGKQDKLKMSVAVGLGVHRYGARDAGAGLEAPAPSPSSNVLAFFGNFSFHVYRRLSIDLAYWITDADDAGGVNGVGNPGGKRSSVGIGYTF
jgi:hypothetical protein